MTLTPQMIEAMNKATGNNVPLDGSTPVQSRADQIRAIGQKATPPAPAETPTFSDNLGSDFSKRGENIVEGVKQGATDIQNSASGKENPLVSGLKLFTHTALNTAGQVAGGVGDIIGETMKGLSNKTENPSNLTQESDKAKAFWDKVGVHIDDLSKKNPTAAKALENVFNLVTIGAGGEAEAPLKAAGKEALNTSLDTAKNIVDKGKSLVTKTSEEVAAKQTQASVDAVNPDLTGKKLTNAYKQVVTGSREVTPSSIFREQGLSPDQQTINLGKRLQDLNLGKDPVKNLNSLGDALKDTETKLDTALKGDPEVQYNLDKQTLGGKLDALKTEKPGDFIGDNGKIYDNVVNFGKKVINDAEDTISGGRDARTAFDSEAKRRFPSAFKDGRLNPETPAGHAIKVVRDTINEHIYNAAPNGSEIQNLIGREADIFRATDNIAPKVAAGHGENLITRLKDTVKKHPYISGLVGLGADKFIKTTTGIGF